MTMLLTVLYTLALVTLCASQSVQSECQWTGTSYTGKSATLDLSCIASQVLETTELGTSGSELHGFRWSICANDEECKGEDVMVRQSLGDRCYTVATWDADVQPHYEDWNGGTWTFMYTNGDADCGPSGRTWSPVFVCAPGVEYEISEVAEEKSTCVYETLIKTQYACTEESYVCGSGSNYVGSEPAANDASSPMISTGWLVVCLLVACFVVYFVFGYMYMALKVNKSGDVTDWSQNVPNSRIWCALPSLVMAGCGATRDVIAGVCTYDCVKEGEEDPGLLEVDVNHV